MASPHEVEVTVVSAKDLKNVNWRHGSLKAYAVLWVDPDRKYSTRIDDEGDASPYWDETLVLPLPGPVDEDTTLFIDIVHAGAGEDIKPLIGSAKLRLREVLSDAGFGERVKKDLHLKRPSGRPQGKLDVEVLIKEPRYRAPEPYYAPPYGVPPPGSSRDYPAPPVYGAPYAAAPPPPNPYYQAAPPTGTPYGSYGYNAPPYGQPTYGQGQPYYGEEKKKSKFGGMGTGLAVGAVAGALGGLALAEGVDALEDNIADDVADKVEDDLGYDGDDY